MLKDNNSDQKKPSYNLDEQYESDKKQKGLVSKIVLSITAVLVVLVVILGISAYNFYTSSIEPLDPNNNEEILVEIPSGASPTDIAHILEESNIINSASVFNIYTRLNDEEGFMAGYYVFAPSMDMEEIITSLQQGGSDVPPDAAKITIPEGYSINQIATLIEENTDYSSEEVMKVIQSEAFLSEMLEQFPELLTSSFEAEDVRYVLEGYLYPATYQFPEEITLEEMLRTMIEKMDEVVSPYYAEIEEQDRTVHEILTIASLVEREGITYEDRTIMVGVFYNRIEENMPLQTDVSILYALEDHKEIVTYQDLEVDSPYNLYQNTGMGPGPFNSPSKDSISAAVHPADTDYLYFLADIDTKEVYFAETYEQHLEYQEQYVDTPE